MMEQCKNPLKPQCNNEDIVVYLQIDQEKRPICQQCWNQLAETAIDWNPENLRDEETNNNKLIQETETKPISEKPSNGSSKRKNTRSGLSNCLVNNKL
ncbi:MAG: hypothetical protein LBH62_05545 [Nitrososphaerota archaeon]|nr:hypothetical protein [Nitrososphaerota archaeon]